MPKIVIADDQPDLLTILVARFKAAGYQVFEARNGAEALAAVRQHKPDVAVLDVMMPELNGFQVCRTMKEDPELAEVPTVLLTAKDSEADKFWGGEVGAALYLTKPIDPAHVVLRVGELLSSR